MCVNIDGNHDLSDLTQLPLFELAIGLLLTKEKCYDLNNSSIHVDLSRGHILRQVDIAPLSMFSLPSIIPS